MDELIRLIDRWQNRRIVVVGDFMLDKYIYGNADRLSPDAPVPVLHAVREESRPGGAANVCLCLRALKCDVTCVGLAGDDDNGKLLRRALQQHGCDVTHLLSSGDRPTIVKQSLIGLAQHRHPQKMFRVDFEKSEPLDDATAKKLLAGVEAALDGPNGAGAAALCLEDYNKGLLDAKLTPRIIELARKRKIPVMVDPAAISDYSRYAGATVITPNRTEAEHATGLKADEVSESPKLAVKLAQQTKIDVIVLTLDRHGALLLERGGEPRHLPTVARNVYDVTGAGDMVLAALAAARANGCDWFNAVRFANIAAGLEVEKFGIVPIPLDEILVNLLQQHHGDSKVRTLDQLLPELEAYRRQGRTVAFTNGCFDVLHVGHIELLRGAAKHADLLVLAINSDVSIRKLKGEGRPIIPESERLAMLSELQSIDYVILFGDGSGGENDTPKPLLRAIKPDVLVKGGQYAHDEVVGWEIVEQYGGKIVTIPHVEGRSTTEILNRIRNGK